MNVSQEQLAALCQAHSPLQLPGSGELGQRDPAMVLWALAGAESSFGTNTSPRHEASYCRGGKYFDVYATRQWGCLAHCSYGPWQVMYANFPVGTDPRVLLYGGSSAATLCLAAAIKRLNQAIHAGATTLAQ